MNAWLTFGAEYLVAMLNALGTDHTTTVMRSFSEFEKVVANVKGILKDIKA